MKVLQVIEAAYRATLEEQDDTIVWITHAMKGAGGDLNVLLRGNAVNYAVQGQDASGLSFGTWEQTQPPTIDADIAGLVGKGGAVYVVEEDVSERGLGNSVLVEGIQRVPRSGIPALMEEHDQIWHW
jgi:sulfur transfer complex TusBCD TusB component (DsrH family)